MPTTSPSLDSLPQEILEWIFDHVELSDYLSYIYCSAVCVRFRQIVGAKPSAFRATRANDTDAVDHSRLSTQAYASLVESILKRPSVPTDAWDPLIMRHFGPLLDNPPLQGLPGPDDGRNAVHAFRRLPWATSPDARAPFLRRDASWRRIPLVGSVGNADRTLIRQLDFLQWRTARAIHGTWSRCFRVDPNSARIRMAGGSGNACVTMGMYYDLLLCGGVLFDSEYTCQWQLVPGCRLPDFDFWRSIGKPMPELVDAKLRLEANPQSAVLLIAGEGDDALQSWRPQNLSHLWVPEQIGWAQEYGDKDAGIRFEDCPSWWSGWHPR